MKHNLSPEESAEQRRAEEAEQRKRVSARRWRVGLLLFLVISILIIGVFAQLWGGDRGADIGNAAPVNSPVGVNLEVLGSDDAP